MSKPDGYWCPMCGDLATWLDHHGACDFKIIRRFTPLAVPEVTTWGESGGAEAVTCRDAGWSTMAMVFNNDGYRWAYHEDGHWAIAGHGVAADAGSVCHDTNITTAINYVAGTK